MCDFFTSVGRKQNPLPLLNDKGTKVVAYVDHGVFLIKGNFFPR